MGRILKLVAIIGLIWVGMEFYNNGVDGAFGGIFSSQKEVEAAGHIRSTPTRVGDHVRNQLKQDEARTKRLLGQ